MARNALLIVLAALVLAPASQAGGPAMLIGVAEDTVKNSDLVRAKSSMTLIRLAGFNAVRLAVYWHPGRTKPTPTEKRLITNAGIAARLSGMQVFVTVTNYGSRTTPLTPESRKEFTQFTASLAQSYRHFRDFIIGNEPNLNRFWLPQFNEDGTSASPAAYYALLAQVYDALKKVSRDITVIGGALAPRGADSAIASRHTHSPTKFILDLGLVYRESGRTKPIMDQFAIHPYQDSSAQPPTVTHDGSRTITLSDYPKLVRLLGRAFDGTAQPGSTLPIVYAEYGFESLIPRSKARRYTGKEPASVRPISEAMQGAYYRQAIKIAFCQPNVRAMLLFLAFDEPNLDRWQSGVYYTDRTPKTTLPIVRATTVEARRGIVARCRGLELPVKPKLTFPKPAELKGQKRMSFKLECEIDCKYVARLEQLPKRSVLETVRGIAAGRTPMLVLFRGKPAKPGRYRIAIELSAAVNPASVPELAASKPFEVPKPG